MLFSDLLTKPTINCQTAENLGNITKIHINKDKIDYILTDKNIKIDTSTITAFKDAVIFDSDIKNYPNFNFFSFNSQSIADSKGKIYGNLIDLQIDKNFKITKIVTNNKNICNAVILSMSDDNILIKRIEQNKKIVTQQAPNGIGIQTTVCNYAFLIGRILQKDVFHNGTILIQKGTAITKKEIDIALKYGKLIDITLYSKFYNIESFNNNIL